MISGISFSATSITAGLDADKPANPKTGSQYLATDTKKQYNCFVAGIWTDVLGVNTVNTSAIQDNTVTPVKMSNDAIFAILQRTTSYTPNVFKRYTGVSGTAIYKQLNSGSITLSYNQAWVWQTAVTYVVKAGDIVNGSTKVYARSELTSAYPDAACQVLHNGKTVCTSSVSTVAEVLGIATNVKPGDILTYRCSSGLSEAPRLLNAQIVGDVETVDIRSYA